MVPMNADPQLHTLIATLHKAYQMYLKDRLKTIGINPGWAPFLLHLATMEGVSQENMARSAGLDPGTAARALFRMEQEGLIIRKADTADRRVMRVSLTRKGRALLPPLQAIETQWEATLVQALTAKEQPATLRALEKITAVLSGDERAVQETSATATDNEPEDTGSTPIAGTQTTDEFPMDDFFN